MAPWCYVNPWPRGPDCRLGLCARTGSRKTLRWAGRQVPAMPWGPPVENGFYWILLVQISTVGPWHLCHFSETYLYKQLINYGFAQENHISTHFNLEKMAAEWTPCAWCFKRIEQKTVPDEKIYPSRENLGAELTSDHSNTTKHLKLLKKGTPGTKEKDHTQL